MRFILAAALLCLSTLSMRGADLLPQVFQCGKQGVAGGLGAGTEMTRITVDVERYPEAICNDRTPAIFYYGRYTKEEDRDKWIIFLQGGGSCTTGQLCAERWCGIDTNYGMDKMSTSLSKPQIRAQGFLSPDARNRFGSWNRVLIFYCSSDGWAGTGTSVVQATVNNVPPREFEIHFKGQRIIDGVLDTLRYAGVHRKHRAARHDDSAAAPATLSWPDLDNAKAVMFAGSSGGGAGVRANLDRVGAKLRATNPNVVYRGVIDAIYATLSENKNYALSVYCANDPLRGCSYETFTKESRVAIDQALFATVDDASCLQWHTANAPGTEWRCSDGEHVNFHHLSTPFFIRQDLLDESLGSGYVETGFGPGTEYAMRVEQEMRNLPVPEEARGAEPGLFIPQCTDHESFTHDDRVFDVKLAGVSWHDAVWNWWTGAQPQKLIRPFTGKVERAPECP